MNLWTRFMDWLYGSKLGSVLRLAATNVVKVAGVVAMDLLVSAATRAVADVDQMDRPGEEKADLVRTQLRDLAVREGMQVGTSILNFILESAVQALHERPGK